MSPDRARNIDQARKITSFPELVTTTDQFLLLDDVGDALNPVFKVRSQHVSEEDALNSLAFDGVNPLPALLVDMNADSWQVGVLGYDPVAGVSVIEHFDLDMYEPDSVAELLRS